jgi:hypothetical protein
MLGSYPTSGHITIRRGTEYGHGPEHVACIARRTSAQGPSNWGRNYQTPYLRDVVAPTVQRVLQEDT